jgi:hypothetical protein
MKRLVYLPIFLLTANLALGQPAMRPADFDHPEDKRRMDKLITWPDIKGDISVILNCFSQVQANGKMESTGCFLQNNYDEPFVAVISQAAKKARLNPAIIDGRERTIFLQFRVEFIAEGEQRRIHFYLNPGYEENVKAYGFEHVAGQRAIGKQEPWMSVCPQRAQYALWVRAYLGEDGKADSPSIQHSDGIMPTETCLDAIKETILSGQYTPALADGEAVPSTYVEFFSN